MNAYIVTIGDELLIGQVIDSNSAWIAEQLNLIGITVSEIISISDKHQHIIDTLTKLEDKTNLVVITGGLGPTRDDITKVALASFMGVEMEFLPEIENHIKDLFDKINKSATDILKDQCFFPKTTEIITNNMGTAPGMWLKKDNLRILSMPGVPYEMKYILNNGGLAKIKKINPNPITILHHTIKTAGIGEDTLAKAIDHIIDTFPANISIAYLPSVWEVRLRLTAKGNQKEELQNLLTRFSLEIESVLGNKIYGYNTDSLPSVVGKRLNEKKLTISTAESCTAGLVGHTIATIPGSSSYYKGSIVSYSNEIKTNQLHVSKVTLQQYGAVSEECVVAMLEGLLESYKTDIGVAISGIAGPGGGSEGKPVGTTWIAYGSKGNIMTKRFQFGNDRLKNMRRATTSSLNLVRLYLDELSM